jgi:hypothetical protein
LQATADSNTNNNAIIERNDPNIDTPKQGLTNMGCPKGGLIPESMVV